MKGVPTTQRERVVVFFVQRQKADCAIDNLIHVCHCFLSTATQGRQPIYVLVEPHMRMLKSVYESGQPLRSCLCKR